MGRHKAFVTETHGSGWSGAHKCFWTLNSLHYLETFRVWTGQCAPNNLATKQILFRIHKTQYLLGGINITYLQLVLGGVKVFSVHMSFLCWSEDNSLSEVSKTLYHYRRVYKSADLKLYGKYFEIINADKNKSLNLLGTLFTLMALSSLQYPSHPKCSSFITIIKR